MEKTEQAIEGDFYAAIKSSVLGKAIKGKVYRPDMRPANAKGEDIVVKLMGATRIKNMQKGELICNIYVPDTVSADGRRVRDFRRIEKLEELILQYIARDTSDYYIDLADGQLPRLEHHEEIDQYCIIARLEFSRVAS